MRKEDGGGGRRRKENGGGDDTLSPRSLFIDTDLRKQLLQRPCDAIVVVGDHFFCPLVSNE